MTPADQPPFAGGGTFVDLVPSGFAVCEMGADAEPDPLHADEEEAIVDAVDRRRREFALGRTCARRALDELGVTDATVAVCEDRAPRWPPGIIGSITHCPAAVAAVVAPSTRWLSVGIDVEVDEPLPPGVHDDVVLPAEWDRLGPGVEPALDRVIFSAKESIYKAWYPVRGSWLDFADVDVTLGATPGAFTALVRRPGELELRCEGAWSRSGGLVRTAVVVSP